MREYNEYNPTVNIIDFKGEDEVNVGLISDFHIGSRYFDADKLKEEIDICIKKNAYTILVGDQLETATRDSVGAGVYEQDEILDQQLETFYDLIEPLNSAGLLLGIHPGNHENRVFISSGLNITKVMARELNTNYFGWGKLHYVKVGNQNYTIYTTHGSGGGRVVTNKIKSAINLANVANADVYVCGHVHHPNYHVQSLYSVDKRRKTVGMENKHFITLGGYLKHHGSYGHMNNYEVLKKGGYLMTFSGTKKEVEVNKIT